MSDLLRDLPAAVIDLLSSASTMQYATVSAAGQPIDTPVLFFPSERLATIDLATGLSYPAKAERARRNPKVGLLIEGRPDEPVISIAGHAAVRDADLQANVDRYLAEAAQTLPYDPDWALAQQAVWYWTRILVEITPLRILWWDDAAAMERPPQRWDAPAGMPRLPSDPTPGGSGSKPAQWAERPWQDLAAQALARDAAGHVSVLDADGFPRPIPARALAQDDAGFVFAVPAGVPWAVAGPACLTFGGLESFVGTVTATEGGRSAFRVERTLPILPMTEDMRQLWQPSDDTRAQLMRRLHEEAARRGQPIPTIARDRPAPSAGYRRRLARGAM